MQNLYTLMYLLFLIAKEIYFFITLIDSCTYALWKKGEIKGNRKSVVNQKYNCFLLRTSYYGK